MRLTAISRLQSQWIISRRADLIFFIFSGLIGYALVVISMQAGGLPAMLFVAVSAIIDGPHVYSTATRVVLDPEERRRHRWLFLLLIPLCLAGPTLSYLFGFHLALFLIMIWGQFHISKQHLGFVFIYKRKAGERSDFKLDRYFILISLMLPFAYYASSTVGFKILPLFLIPGFLFAAYYSWHQFGKLVVNGPKLMLLATFIPLHWLAWGFATEDPHSFPRLVAAATITTVGHGIQYLRLMWLHNRNRYATREGLLGTISRKWIYFVAAAAVLSLPQYAPHVFTSNVISMGVLGFLMLHYVMDSKIWRIRSDPEMAQALNLSKP